MTDENYHLDARSYLIGLFDKKPWVGLTDEDELDWEEGDSLKDLVKAIEAKLKDKNT